MFNKLLIANRGEIAVRVMRACRELGIATVAVYSEVDAGAYHVRMADEAVALGGATPAESYLRGEAIIAAALATGAEAIHPGYGFLAENAAFAEAVTAAGLTWIGPPASAIRTMGDKTTARAAMTAAGVPVVPGYQPAADEEMSLGWFADEAARIGYPVLLKAAAGGGGKGMRVVETAAELAEAYAAANREAQKAFGDGRLFIEKYLPAARHIEFQVLADSHGNTVHLLERECSVQRRHQKIIEECPAPGLTPDLRAAMGATAVAAAQAVGYVNAGTIEFIVDAATRDYYFLEMNTRLQVEHPVTEWVTGLDLVQLQIMIAGGAHLPFTQAEIQPRGHAIECRVYAEDPANGFLPDSGPVLLAAMPGGPGIRVDAGVETGDSVSVYYDPMIAKISVFGANRVQARLRMAAALNDTAVLGLQTNLAFLQAVLAHPEYAAGQVTTRWVENELAGWQPPQGDDTLAVIVAAVAAHGQRIGGGVVSAGSSDGDAYSPWALADGFRMGGQ